MKVSVHELFPRGIRPTQTFEALRGGLWPEVCISLYFVRLPFLVLRVSAGEQSSELSFVAEEKPPLLWVLCEKARGPHRDRKLCRFRAESR